MDSLKSVPSANKPIDIAACLPPITYDTSVSNMMTEHFRSVLEYYFVLIQIYLSQQQIPHIERLEVSLYIDPDESFQQLVVTHRLHTTADVAMKYWEDIDNQVEHGLDSASAEIAETIRDFIVTSVRWKIDDNTE